MSEPDILVATTNALLFSGEERIAIRRGITTVRAGHPLLAGREHLFAPFTVDHDYDPNTPAPEPEADPEPVPAGGPDPKAVRAWAAEHGIDVPARGKLSADVLAQYAAAQEA